MKKDEKFRCGLAIVEQPNGMYQAVSTATIGYYETGVSTSYPNLTWVEVATLVHALLEEWADVRATGRSVPAEDPWIQLSLLEIAEPDV